MDFRPLFYKDEASRQKGYAKIRQVGQAMTGDWQNILMICDVCGLNRVEVQMALNYLVKSKSIEKGVSYERSSRGLYQVNRYRLPLRY